jgi:Concanavalin A-like lectin/glucanases superfamily
MRALKPATPRIYPRTGAPDAWFLMDQPRQTRPGDAGDVWDLTGNLSAGSRSTATTWGNGAYGANLQFAGSTTGVDLGANVLPRDSGCTMLIRATPTSISGYRTLLAHDSGSGGWWLHSGQSNPYFAGGQAVGSATVSAGETHEWAVTCAAGGVPALYLDGLPDSSTWGATSNPALSYRYIGADNGGDSFVGSMDWVKYWGRILSPAEIAREYADPFHWLQPPPRKAWWFTSAPDLATLAGAAQPAATAFVVVVPVGTALQPASRPGSVDFSVSQGDVSSLGAAAQPAGVAFQASIPQPAALSASAGAAAVNLAAVISGIVLDLKQVITAALKAEPALNALISGRVFPSTQPQSQALPALNYWFIASPRARHLRGSAGIKTVRVRFLAQSPVAGDLEQIREILRNLFDGLIGPLGALVMCFVHFDPFEFDEYVEPLSGSDAGTYTKTFDVLFKLRESIPTNT